MKSPILPTVFSVCLIQYQLPAWMTCAKILYLLEGFGELMECKIILKNNSHQYSRSSRNFRIFKFEKNSPSYHGDSTQAMLHGLVVPLGLQSETYKIFVSKEVSFNRKISLLRKLWRPTFCQYDKLISLVVIISS